MDGVWRKRISALVKRRVEKKWAILLVAPRSVVSQQFDIYSTRQNNWHARNYHETHSLCHSRWEWILCSMNYRKCCVTIYNHALLCRGNGPDLVTVVRWFLLDLFSSGHKWWCFIVYSSNKFVVLFWTKQLQLPKFQFIAKIRVAENTFGENSLMLMFQMAGAQLCCILSFLLKSRNKFVLGSVSASLKCTPNLCKYFYQR